MLQPFLNLKLSSPVMNLNHISLLINNNMITNSKQHQRSNGEHFSHMVTFRHIGKLNGWNCLQLSRDLNPWPTTLRWTALKDLAMESFIQGSKVRYYVINYSITVLNQQSRNKADDTFLLSFIAVLIKTCYFPAYSFWKPIQLNFFSSNYLKFCLVSYKYYPISNSSDI